MQRTTGVIKIDHVSIESLWAAFKPGRLQAQHGWSNVINGRDAETDLAARSGCGGVDRLTNDSGVAGADNQTRSGPCVSSSNSALSIRLTIR